MFRRYASIGLLTALIITLFSLQLPAVPEENGILSGNLPVCSDLIIADNGMTCGNSSVTEIPDAGMAEPFTYPPPQPPLSTIFIPAEIRHSGAIVEVAIAVGDTFGEDLSSYYVLENDLKISNPSNETVRNLKLEIPLMADIDSPYQACMGEEFSLEPVKIDEEENGNRTGYFVFDNIAPGQEVILVQKYVIKVNGTDWLQADQNIELADREEYLAAGAKIESTAPQIVAVAKNIASQVSQEDNLAIVKAAFEFTRSTLTYDKNSPSANKGALAGLQARAGVCEEYASLFVATSRAAGVPARVVNGYASDVAELAKDANPRVLQGRRHQWAEFYLDGKGWIPADPTLTSEESPMFGELPTGHYVAQNYGDEPIKGTYRGGKVDIGFEDKVAKSDQSTDESHKH